MKGLCLAHLNIPNIQYLGNLLYMLGTQLVFVDNDMSASQIFLDGLKLEDRVTVRVWLAGTRKSW